LFGRKAKDVLGSFEFADKNDLDVFVLGGGSNILVSDRGFDGLVVQVSLKGRSDIPSKSFHG
jgi:UDP-N-acetylmuramate dehydrogenase